MNRFGAERTPQYDNSVFELDHPSPKAGGLDSFINRFSGMSESYFFYNNTVELRFDKNEHVYYKVEELGNLTEQNGVTNTVHIINAAEMLVPWAAKMTIAKLLRLIPVEEIDGVLRIKPITLEEFTTIALEAKSAHKDKLDEAGDIGHMAHKCLEESILHAIANDPDKTVRTLIHIPTDERAANAANGGKYWMDQHRVKWIETETKIYSKRHGYAGTMDGLAYVSSCGDKSCCKEQFVDRLSLIDWKSSNYLKIGYLFQTASYQAAKQEEFPNLKIVDRWILRLGKSDEEAGKFEPWHMGPEDFEADFKGFLACLALTRVVDEVETRMKDQKKRIRAVRKEMKEAAKTIKKEQEKLEKALKKAEEKKKREEEKVRLKAEAKANREAAKAAKKKKTIADVALKEQPCTSTSTKQAVTNQDVSASLVSTNQTDASISNPCLPTEKTETPRVPQRIASTFSMVETEPEVKFKPIELPGEK